MYMPKDKFNKYIGGDDILTIKPIFVVTLNIIILIVYVFIIICLYKFSTNYKANLILFILLGIVSFFKIPFISWGTLNMFKPLISIFTKNNNQINYPTTTVRLISFIILFLCTILQFITTILITIIIYRNPSDDNSFVLTVTNNENFKYYLMYYIYTIVYDIIVSFVLTLPLTDEEITKKSYIFYYISILFSVPYLVSYSYKLFIYCFSIYSNVIINKNPLYQGN
jgi:energy-converting hydrogenase Eha subunit A